ncbi:MAG: DUF4350 domain-containing protein, partial [Steroidobacteraceae bacterium]|nr:DUF4350 domain-containing protein [Steroidobacteraceae bacterium]MDW8259417.1 DUF4350 domain-containing protein [Gammaproteobacteria bacterium]
VTLALAGGALALFYSIFLGSSPLKSRDPTARPTTSERGGGGYSALAQWLRRSGVPYRSLRERFAALPASDSGSLLIVTLPGAVPVRTEEIAPLEQWLRRGNTLLVLAALADTPEWALDSAGIASDFNALTGLELETVSQRDRRRKALARAEGSGNEERARPANEVSDEAGAGWQSEFDTDAPEDDARLLLVPQVRTALPAGSFPWFAGVRRLEALSDYATRGRFVRAPIDTALLALAREPSSGEAVVWLRGFGRGRIVIVCYGSLLTNRVIGRADNARWFADLVAASVGAGGFVWIDELHQGISNLYDPEKFFSDPRLYRTIAILLAVWLVWVLGSTRLRAASAAPAVLSESELIRVSGNFYARVLTSTAGARRLAELFFERLRRRVRVRSTADCWAWLERQPAVAAADLQRLRALTDAVNNDRPVDLLELQTLLAKLSRQTV